MSDSTVESPRAERKHELRVFLFLTVVLAPLLAVAIVGGYGFLVWIFQMFAGPPGPAS
ncbi:MAG TPA: periplasmic nitrate reductase, NapE protein [Permianibacter sp.]|nr:periplasmic nitrate reductase, NapE protein [Permianibacter sp.]